MGLLAGLVPVLLGATPAAAVVTTNACQNTASPNATQLDADIVGTVPATVSPGSNFTLSGLGMNLALPGALFVAGYNLNLLNDGDTVPGTVFMVIEGVNTVQGTQNTSTENVSVGPIDITDPDGVRGSGDETALPANVSVAFDNQTWTAGPSGTISFREDTIPLSPGVGGIVITATVGGFLQIGFRCSPGTVTPPDPGIITLTDPGATFASTEIFQQPDTAPVALDDSATIPSGQSGSINVIANDTDINGNLDPTSVAIVTPPTAGTATPNPDGTVTYTNTNTSALSDSFTYTVSDTTNLTSNVATVNVNLLANLCDATSGSCDLTEIVVQPVVGTTMTMVKAEGAVVMTPVVLNGAPQASSGAIQPIVVTNARGTANAWNVTGYITDLGAPGSPTIEPLPGVVIPTCSLAGGGGSAHRLCIPGDNMAWQPSAQITHDIIFGDVAQVNAGPAHATSASGWLSALIAAGAGGLDGLGGLLTQNLLCGAPVDHSGGTFQCDASLFLGVPASAGAGTYTGGLVLTLV